MTDVAKYTGGGHAGSPLMNPPHTNGLATAMTLGSEVVIKKVDESVCNSQVVQNDDELFFQGLANAVYKIVIHTVIVEDPPSGGFQGTVYGGSWSSIHQIILGGSWTAIDPLIYEIYGTLIMGGADDVIHFKWAQSSPTADCTTLKAGSYLTYSRSDLSGSGVTNGDAHDHYGGDGGQIAYSHLSGLPTLGTIADNNEGDFAVASKGVTNGDSHDHNGGDGSQIAYGTLSGTPTIREVLFANRTYYVRTDGNDANTGLIDTAGGAFLTIQHAVNVVAALDLSIYNVVIQLADGTYFHGCLASGPFVGSGILTIQGNNVTPSNVLVSTTSENAFCSNFSALIVHDLKIETTTSGYAIIATNNGAINFQGVDFGACSQSHIRAENGGIVTPTGNYVITGGAIHHFDAFGIIRFSTAATVTLIGTPYFSYGFAFVQLSGFLVSWGVTYTGSATGYRFIVQKNGAIVTNAGGPSYFPGDTAGIISTGGLYDSIPAYLLEVYPIGAVYISVLSTSPVTLFGGTWAYLGPGRVLVSLDAGDADFDTVEETGGAKTVTVAQHAAKNSDAAGVGATAYGTTASTVTLKAHVHNITAYTHAAASIVQPYLVVYMWKRTA
jgi:hypothetical protein